MHKPLHPSLAPQNLDHGQLMDMAQESTGFLDVEHEPGQVEPEARGPGWTVRAGCQQRPLAQQFQPVLLVDQCSVLWLYPWCMHARTCMHACIAYTITETRNMHNAIGAKRSSTPGRFCCTVSAAVSASHCITMRPLYALHTIVTSPLRWYNLVRSPSKFVVRITSSKVLSLALQVLKANPRFKSIWSGKRLVQSRPPYYKKYVAKKPGKSLAFLETQVDCTKFCGSHTSFWIVCMHDAAEFAQTHVRPPKCQRKVGHAWAQVGHKEYCRLKVGHQSVKGFKFVLSIMGTCDFWQQHFAFPQELPSRIVPPLTVYRMPKCNTCIKHQRMIDGWNLQRPMSGPYQGSGLGSRSGEVKQIEHMYNAVCMLLAHSIPVVFECYLNRRSI